MRMGDGAPARTVDRPSDARVVVAVAVAAFAVLRLAALTRYPLWGDETWTLDIGRNAFARAMRLYADDQTHPPLFYAILWAWRRAGGEANAWLRLLPCAAGMATAIPVVALARAARFSRRATWLSIVLCAGSGILVAYSAELRDYAFLALMGTASLAVWLRARDAAGGAGLRARDASGGAGLRARDASGGASLRALTLVNGILLYSHYFGVFVVLAEWCDAAVWARRRLRAMTTSAVVSLAALLPWVAETVERAMLTGHRLDVLDWLQRPHPADLLDLPIAAIGPSPWPALDLGLIVAGGAAVGLWAWRRRDSGQSAAIRLLVLAVALPVGVSFLESVVGPRPMWLDRYLIAAVPPMLLLVAGAMDGLVGDRPAATAGLVAMACVPGAITAASLVRGRERPRYDAVVERLAHRHPDGIVEIVAGNTLDGGPLTYAARAAGLSRRVRVAVRPPSDAGADSGWYVWSESHPPAGITPPAALIRAGHGVSGTLVFDSARDPVSAVWFAPRPAPHAPRPAPLPPAR